MLADDTFYDLMINLPYKIGAVVTGGGASAFTDMLSRGGMSSVIEEVSIPYGLNANAQFLNDAYMPSHCSEAAAIMLAAAQVERMDYIENPMAVACTSSLFTEGQRKDRVNQAWICIATEGGTFVTNIIFAPEQGRYGQEEALAYNLLNCIVL